MTPSNTPNQQPLIYRIADALGVFHLVAPVNHTHSQDEITGLESALAAKANKVAAGSPSGGIVIAGTSGELARSNKTVQDLLNAIDEKNSINQVDEDDEQEAHLNAVAEDDDIYFKFRLKNGSAEKQVILTMPKMDNLERALNAPDSTPTANSDNLVTSGGVKDAIDNAIAIRYSNSKPLIEDIFGDANLQKVDCCILNSTGSEASITDLFHISVGQTLYLPDNAPTIPNGKMVLLHLYRTATQGYFMVSIGGIYTVS